MILGQQYLDNAKFTSFGIRSTSSNLIIERNINFQGNVIGNYIPIVLSIENTYKATIGFCLFSVCYTFTIERWARRGLAEFLNHFHAFVPRHIPTFGLRVEDKNGFSNFFEDTTDITSNPDGTYLIGANARAMTLIQKLNCIEQACKDILTCLEQIGSVHQRSILEYAVYYRENYSNPGSYSEYITLLTCQSIGNNNFMAPNIPWKLVEF